MKIQVISLLKMVCAAFVLYYTLFSVIIPEIQGYLLLIGVFMVGSICIYMMICHTNVRDLLDFPIKCWILFGIVEFIASYFVALDVSFAQSSIFTFFELVVMCFSMIFIAKEEGNAEFFIKLMYFTCITYVIYMLINNNQISGRLALVNANGDANVCLIGIVTATLVLNIKKRIQPVIIIGSICLMAYANIMTGSRKSFICMIFYLVFWLIVFLKTEWRTIDIRKKLLILMMVLILVAVIIQWFIPVIMNSTTMIRILSGSTEGDDTRISLYSEAWQHFINNPIFGIGYNQFRLYNADGLYSHSTYAEILADGGLVGTVLFFLPHVWCIVNLVKIEKENRWKSWQEVKKALLLLVYMFSSLILAFGMVQTSNERVLMMYAVMFAYIICYRKKQKR